VSQLWWNGYSAEDKKKRRSNLGKRKYFNASYFRGFCGTVMLKKRVVGERKGWAAKAKMFGVTVVPTGGYTWG